jgi:hypothetical protein
MKPGYKKYFTIVAAIWACCALVFMAAYMFLLAPERKIAKQIKQQLEQKKRIYTQAQHASEDETKVRARKEIETLKSKLNDFVADSHDSSNVTFDISQIGREKEVNSFSSKANSSRRDTQLPGCELITQDHITIEFKGSFNQFAALLSRLERNRPVVFVDQFTMLRSKKKDSQHAAKMDLAFYVRKEEQDSETAGTI